MRLNVFVVFIRRVVAQKVHIKAGALLDHRQTNSPGADDRNGFAGDFIAQKRQIWMPESPLVIAGQVLRWPHLPRQHSQHEEREFSSRFREHVGSMGEGNFVLVGVRAIDVVKPNRELGHNFERSLAGFENFRINLVAQSCDQAVDSRAHFFQNQRLRRSFRIGINFELVAALAKNIQRRSDVAGRKNAKAVSHWKV